MILLKSKLSGFYFKDFGIWVTSPAEAQQFANQWEAREFAMREHLGDVIPEEHEGAVLRLAA